MHIIKSILKIFGIGTLCEVLQTFWEYYYNVSNKYSEYSCRKYFEYFRTQNCFKKHFTQVCKIIVIFETFNKNEKCYTIEKNIFYYFYY